MTITAYAFIAGSLVVKPLAMHGTLKLNVPQSKIMIGVSAHMEPGDNRLIKLLKKPFTKPIDDWIAEDGAYLFTRDSDVDSSAKVLAG